MTPEDGSPQRAFSVAGLLAAALLAVVGALSLAGCASNPPLQIASLQTEVTAEKAFVMPPPGGPAIVSVLQKRYANGLEQTVFLATNSALPGQNSIRVRLGGKTDNSEQVNTAFDEGFLALKDPSREAFGAIPGVAMQRSPYFVKNRYGPFGYSVGRRGNDLCLYGWQQIRARQAIVGERGLVDIRVRACRSGATEQQLLAIMYGYTISGYLGDEGWNPYGDAPPPSADLAGPGANIYPASTGGYLTVLPEPVVREAPRASVRVRRPAATSAARQPAARGPVVPPPPDRPAAPLVPAPPTATR